MVRSLVFPLLAGFLASVLFACAGCQRHKDIVEAQTANWNDVAAVLKGVQDTESMDDAERQLARLATKFKDVSRRAKGLPDPGPETREQLVAETAKLQAAVQEAMKEIDRIKTLPGGPDFFERFNDLMAGPKRVNR